MKVGVMYPIIPNSENGGSWKMRSNTEKKRRRIMISKEALRRSDVWLIAAMDRGAGEIPEGSWFSDELRQFNVRLFDSKRLPP